MTFDQWMRATDSWLVRLAGLSSADLPDQEYRAAWEAEVRPETQALDTLEQSGYPLGLLEDARAEVERLVRG